MQFKKLIEELDKLDLPQDQFAITASGCLAVRGLREASDLDIIVTEKLWNKLAGKYPIIPGPPCDVIKIGNVEILGIFSKYTDQEIATVEEQIETADIIDGYRFVNLKLVRKFKEN